MRRALIAEDDVDMSRAVARALRSELGPAAHESGAGLILDVEEALTVPDAFCAVWERPPDVLVADVGMFTPPDLAWLLRAAREQRRPRAVYALIVSARRDEELVDAALSCAPNDWLPKPFSVGALVEKVRGGLAHLDACDAAFTRESEN